MFGPLTSERLEVLVSVEAMETAVWKYWLFKRGRRRCCLNQPSAGFRGGPGSSAGPQKNMVKVQTLMGFADGALDKGNLQNRKANMESK